MRAKKKGKARSAGKALADERDDSLLRAMDSLRERLAGLESSTDPVECVAQGKLEVALFAIDTAADLLGEGP